MAETIISEDVLGQIGLLFDAIKGLATKEDIDEKIKGLATKEDIETVKSKIKKLKNSQEDLERQFTALKTFPTPPNSPPNSAQVVVQGSVSNPEWRNRSIYG